jgi:hypothetical protein
MKPTQYLYSKSNGMLLRSGRTINNFTTSDLHNDMIHMITQSHCRTLQNYKVQTPFNSSNPNTFCNVCFKLISLLDIAEKYGKELRGETNNIKGDDKKFSTKQKLYVTVRAKINDFISTIDTSQCQCKHDAYDISYFDYLDGCLNDIIVDKQYAHMANYKGHGPERALYRKYHRNFVKLLNNGRDFQGFIYVLRDFDKIKKELIHWSKFFNKPRC